MARILLGVSGGIAAYKALELARLATKRGHGVRVLMTPTAGRFVGAASFEGIVGAPVLTDEFERDPMRGAFPGDEPPAHDPIGHLELVANADAYLVAPASANTIAKLAAGICDSILTTSFLACTAPRLVAPAMNDRMYADAATQANLATLRERGIVVIEPDSGALASRGEYGTGRLPDARAAARGGRGAAAGARRFLGRPPGPGHRRRHPRADRPGALHRQPLQRPDGRRARRRRGPSRRRRHPDRRQPRRAGRRPGSRRSRSRRPPSSAPPSATGFEGAHVLLMAAAPADFRAAAPERSKISRTADGGLELRLESTEDILAGVAAARGAPDQTLVGFAAETGADAIGRAREKLERKAVDAIVFNDVSRPEIGFDSADNEVTIVERAGEHHVPLASKDEVAEAILDRVEAIRSEVESAT